MRIDLEKKLLSLEVVQLITAVGLFISPWAFGYSGLEPAAWSAWLTAGVVVVLASLTSVDEPDWAGWGTLAAGLWAILSPTVLGYAENLGGFWSHVTAGAVVTVSAIVVLWLTMKRTTQTA